MKQFNNLPAGKAGIPNHIAIIMDGNRRWAKSRHLPSLAGHKYAADHIVEELTEKAGEMGIKYVTFWAWSTENWGREEKEVKGMMKLLHYYLNQKIAIFHKKGAKLRVIGDTSKFPHNIQTSLKKSLEKTKNNTKITIIFALNYGGRDEILRAIKRLSGNYQLPITNYQLTQEEFSKYLDTAGIPDPDIIIRTGGEKRLSGFLPWQSEYSELYFTDTLFPDFNKKELQKSIDWYQQRNRRFGR
ncbi:di-trans,poly-cis-decaprenylcistransferase [Candidatus Gottesmanbacteria bacterium]|nr:di-trans,poly-cis-decaprenylcistransferase [Candidatus Gottesmanbacteria bacterium]